MIPLHVQRTHPVFDPSCFGCRAAHVLVSPAVYATERGPYRAQRKVSLTVERDGEAYWRLRREGLQPPHIAGSAFLERQADTRFEIERGKVYKGEAKKAYEEATVVLDDGGFGPGVAHTAPKPRED